MIPATAKPVFNSEDAARFYEWLGHNSNEFTEIRVVNPEGTKAQSFFVKSKAEFIRVCEEWSGRFHVYAGVNPRKTTSGKTEDTTRVTAFPLDVDPPKYKRNQSATDNEKKVALDRLQEVKNYMDQRGFLNPYIDDSGNGYRLAYKLNIPISNHGEIDAKLKAFFAEIKREFSYLDNISDLPRIIKVAGSMNLKGEDTPERPHRISKLIQVGDLKPNIKLQNYIQENKIGETAPTLSDTTKKVELDPNKIKQLRPCMQHFLMNGGRFIAKGDRNAETGARKSFYAEMIEANFSQAEILTASSGFDDFNPVKCQRELDKLYVTKRQEGALKPWKCETLQGYGICIGDECSFYVKKAGNYHEKEHGLNGNNKYVKKSQKNEPDMGFALELLNKHTYKCPTDTEEVLVYNDGLYEPAKPLIWNILESEYGDDLKRHFVDEAYAHLQRANIIKREEINRYTNKIPIKNGLLNFLAREVEPFDPEQIYTYKLNVEYNSTKDCPKFKKFVEQIQPDENDRKLLQEIMGYCLLPDMPFHKIFWFYGVGRNGKGRIILTLEYILGKENCSELSLSDFRESRRFALCHLYGKLLNVSSEPNPKYPLETNNIKLCTGEDTIYAELKGKNRRLRFTNKAKLIVLGNRFPKVDDTSVGFWDRVEVLNFPASFVGEDNIPHIERTWLDDPDEVSGTMNWMLEGLYRLIQNKKFSSSKTTEETKLEFMKISNAFNAWISECCKFQPEAYLTRQEAYDHYKKYAYEIGVEPDNTRIFYPKMRQTPRVKDVEKRINGKLERIFQGIALKHESDAHDAHSTTQEIVQHKKKEVKTSASSASSASVGDFNVDSCFPSGQFPVCFSCHKPIVQLESLTNIDGRPIHKSCKQKIEDQKKKKDWKCPEHAAVDGRPFCNRIQIFLAKPEDCSDDCSLLEEALS